MSEEVRFDEGNNTQQKTQSSKTGFGREGFVGPQMSQRTSMAETYYGRKIAWPIRLLFKLRIARTEKRAYIIISVLFVIAVGVAFYIARDTLVAPEVRELTFVKISAA
jgi:hypothetical protein